MQRHLFGCCRRRSPACRRSTGRASPATAGSHRVPMHNRSRHPKGITHTHTQTNKQKRHRTGWRRSVARWCSHLVGHKLQDFGDVQRVQLLVRPQLRLHVNSAVSAHGKRRAKGLLRQLGADGDRDDLRSELLLLQTNRLLNRDLTEGVHRHLHAGEVNAWCAPQAPKWSCRRTVDDNEAKERAQKDGLQKAGNQRREQ